MIIFVLPALKVLAINNVSCPVTPLYLINSFDLFDLLKMILPPKTDVTNKFKCQYFWPSRLLPVNNNESVL